jgi:hypothetical protein
MDFLMMFVLGLVSSPHCAQMCGPIVLSYSLAGGASPSRRALFSNHLAYNSGRLLTYSLLGTAAGLVGSSMGLLGKLTGFGGTLALAAGILLVIVGLAMFGVVPGSQLLSSRAFQFTYTFLRPCGKLIAAPGTWNRFFLGLSLGFLPCGLIYAALVKAAATASLVEGATSMLAFGLGTTLALVAIGFLSSALRQRLSRWNAPLAALSVTVMGLLLIWRSTMAGAMMSGMHPGHVHH